MRDNIFIGMSSGMVFAFYMIENSDQKKIKIVAEEKLENGDPITCLSATMDAQFLLIGYSSGEIMVVDIKSG